MYLARDKDMDYLDYETCGEPVCIDAEATTCERCGRDTLAEGCPKAKVSQYCDRCLGWEESFANEDRGINVSLADLYFLHIGLELEADVYPNKDLLTQLIELHLDTGPPLLHLPGEHVAREVTDTGWR